MKTIWGLATAAVLGIAVAASAGAETRTQVATAAATAQQTAAAPADTRTAGLHYEWRYHYVGSHARFVGYWALVP